MQNNEITFNETAIIADLKASGKHEAVEIIQSLTAELETVMENLNDLSETLRSDKIIEQ